MKPVLSDHSKIGRISAVINQIAFFKCVDFVEAKSSLKFAFRLYLVANLTENVHHKNLCDYLSRLYTIEERLQRGGGVSTGLVIGELYLHAYLHIFY